MENTVEIRYLRYQNFQSRIVAYGQIYDNEDNKVFPTRGSVDAPLVQLMMHIDDEELELSNGADILYTIVVKNGAMS